MISLAAIVLLSVWGAPPTADVVLIYSSERPACVRPVLTNAHPWCYQAPRACRRGRVDVAAFEVGEVLSGPVSVGHEALRPGEVMYISAVPVRGCWEFNVRLEVSDGD